MPWRCFWPRRRKALLAKSCFAPRRSREVQWAPCVTPWGPEHPITTGDAVGAGFIPGRRIQLTEQGAILMRTVSSRLFLFVALLGLGAGASLAATSSWQIDPAHSAATFSVRHLMISNVKGEFSKVTGVVNLDEQDVTKSTVEVTIH